MILQVLWVPVVLHWDQRIGFELLLRQFHDLMVKIDQLLVFGAHLTVEFAQSSLHARVFILNFVKFNLQVVILMGDFFDLDRWLDCMTAF